MNFGKNFKKIRKECGLTQKQVAEKLGIQQSSVSDWENDVGRPEYENLIKLTEIYSSTLNELLDYDKCCKELNIKTPCEN